MYSAKFNFTPFNATMGINTLPFFNHSLINTYAQQTRKMFEMQFAFADMATFGLISDLRDEIEHSLVEGSETLENLFKQLHQLDVDTASEQEKQVLIQDALDKAQGNLKTLISQLTTNLLTLPFTRGTTKPSRKRFPVTIEGSATIVD